MNNNNTNSSGIDISEIAESLLEKQLKTHDENQSFEVDWATEFENGFLDHITLMINPDLKKGYWGLGAENRPRIVTLNTKDNATSVEGYRLIEFLPDRDNKNESYFFFGTPIELMSQCCQFFNQWLLSSKNNNQSSNNDDSIIAKNKPLEGIFIKIYLATKKTPPFYKTPNDKSNNVYYSIRCVTIPVANRSQITYENLRKVCDDSKGQNWGLWTARAYIRSDLGIHQIVCGGNTEESSVKNLQKFLTLTNGQQFRSISTRHDYSNLTIPKSFDLYPAYVKITNYDDFNYNTNTDNNIPNNNLTKKRIIKRETINIYYETVPTWVQKKLSDVLKIVSKDKTKQ